MLAQDLSRLLKGTYFANGETAIVNFQSETSLVKQLESMTDFVKSTMSVKKSLKSINFEEYLDVLLEDDNEEPGDLKDKLSKIAGSGGFEFLILEGMELLLCVENRALKILRCLYSLIKQLPDLSKLSTNLA